MTTMPHTFDEAPITPEAEVLAEEAQAQNSRNIEELGALALVPGRELRQHPSFAICDELAALLPPEVAPGALLISGRKSNALNTPLAAQALCWATKCYYHATAKQWYHVPANGVQVESLECAMLAAARTFYVSMASLLDHPGDIAGGGKKILNTAKELPFRTRPEESLAGVWVAHHLQLWSDQKDRSGGRDFISSASLIELFRANRPIATRGKSDFVLAREIKAAVMMTFGSSVKHKRYGGHKISGFVGIQYRGTEGYFREADEDPLE